MPEFDEAVFRELFHDLGDGALVVPLLFEVVRHLLGGPRPRAEVGHGLVHGPVIGFRHSLHPPCFSLVYHIFHICVKVWPRARGVRGKSG